MTYRYPRLNIGSRFQTSLGPSRLTWAGCEGYFQKDNRRYLCRVLEAHDEPYRGTRWTEYGRHQVINVEVIGT